MKGLQPGPDVPGQDQDLDGIQGPQFQRELTIASQVHESSLSLVPNQSSYQDLDGEQGPTGTFSQVDNPGDILFWSNSEWSVLPIGSEGDILTVSEGFPSWSPQTTGSNGGSDNGGDGFNNTEDDASNWNGCDTSPTQNIIAAEGSWWTTDAAIGWQNCYQSPNTFWWNSCVTNISINMPGVEYPGPPENCQRQQ